MLRGERDFLWLGGLLPGRSPRPSGPLLTPHPARTPPFLLPSSPSAPASSPAALIPLLGSQRAGSLQAGGGGQAPGRRRRPHSWWTVASSGSEQGDMQGLVRTPPPQGARRKGRTPQPAERLLPPPWWAGGQDLHRGHGGPPLGHAVWEGGIYRLLFTKTRPHKTFNGSQLKGDSCVV